jgi:hypothetical protein
MKGWLESIFGSPQPPAHPASRGSLMGLGGYQDMPTSQNIEDRRSNEIYNYVPSRPHDLNWESTNDYNPFDPAPFFARVNVERAGRSWADTNMPVRLATTPLPDPDFISADPSIVAHQRAWEDMMARAYPPNWQGPSLPDGSERGPRVAGPLTGGMWDGS